MYKVVRIYFFEMIRSLPGSHCRHKLWMLIEEDIWCVSLLVSVIFRILNWKLECSIFVVCKVPGLWCLAILAILCLCSTLLPNSYIGFTTNKFFAMRICVGFCFCFCFLHVLVGIEIQHMILKKEMWRLDLNLHLHLLIWSNISWESACSLWLGL